MNELKTDLPKFDFYCDKIDTYVTAQFGWEFCPYCGAELEPIKHIVPQRHEVNGVKIRP